MVSGRKMRATRPTRKTPLTMQQAVRKASSRSEVELLLRDLENHEARLPAEERFELGALRRQLGLAER